MKRRQLLLLVLAGTLLLCSCNSGKKNENKNTPETTTTVTEESVSETESITVATSETESTTVAPSEEKTSTESEETATSADNSKFDFTKYVGTWYADSTQAEDCICIKAVDDVLLDDTPEPRQPYAQIDLNIFFYRVMDFHTVVISQKDSNTVLFEASDSYAGDDNSTDDTPSIKGVLTFRDDSIELVVTESNFAYVEPGTSMVYKYYKNSTTY